MVEDDALQGVGVGDALVLAEPTWHHQVLDGVCARRDHRQDQSLAAFAGFSRSHSSRRACCCPAADRLRSKCRDAASSFAKLPHSMLGLALAARVRVFL
eukprot:1255539-Alexandrium_andersonii.AAC.1